MIRRPIHQLTKVLSLTVTKHCLCGPADIYKFHIPIGTKSHQSRNLFTTPNLHTSEDSWLNRKTISIRTKLGMAPRSKAYYRLRGLLLFQGVEMVKWKDFFTVFNMPDTFHSWFLVMELHMWMLSVRENDEGVEGELIKRFAIEQMWEGAQKRARKLESYSPSSIRDGFDALNEEFLAAFVMYDHGLLTSDTALADALWYRFLQEKCDDPEKLELLVKHVRKQIHLLDQMSKEDVIDRVSISWSSISDKTFS